MQKLTPSKVGISPAYQKKEMMRAKLQALIENSITSGEVSNQDELEELFKALQMSLTALKSVPFDVYQKTSTRLK